jgi:hypothetical protein
MGGVCQGIPLAARAPAGDDSEGPGIPYHDSGTMRMEEYERHFTKMMRYAADDTNTEEKKQF